HNAVVGVFVAREDTRNGGKNAVVRVFKNRRCSCLHEQPLPLLVFLLRVKTRATARKKPLLFVSSRTTLAVVGVPTNNHN
ncbi:MAG: hypothetical protein NZM39_11630, partial [Bernardetiaceae bacterium]|nr:hypothetical protein [Bernardetiaceae bacterium]